MFYIQSVASGKEYRIGTFEPGMLQYADRDYVFAYIPIELKGCSSIITYGSDKMISEDQLCFSIVSDMECDVYVLYPDKQPVIPKWLTHFERMRMNVSREDSDAMTLKGYFTLYKKHFPPGEIAFFGNSPKEMLDKDWYVKSRGTNYCMYSVVVK